MDHNELLNLAKHAIDVVFSDRSVSRQQTRDSLEILQEELTVLIESVTD